MYNIVVYLIYIKNFDICMWALYTQYKANKEQRA
jgi:hypothetical protein